MNSSSEGAQPATVSQDRVYTTGDVSRLTGVSVARLRRWSASGVLRVEKAPNGRLLYAFSDVVAARAAKALFERGARSKRVRQAIDAIRAWRPDIAQPLASVKVEVQENKVIVSLDGQTIEPGSGQLLMTLSDTDLNEKNQVVRYPIEKESPEPETASAVFGEALAAERLGDFETAERAYRRTLSLDPTHAWALINLGNITFSSGHLTRACELYRTATLAAPNIAAAWYNLANALDELEEPDDAIESYETCIRLDPDYSDAHFNLALLWEKLGRRHDAKPHWNAFIRLAPTHPSPETAQAFLDALD